MKQESTLKKIILLIIVFITFYLVLSFFLFILKTFLIDQLDTEIYQVLYDYSAVFSSVVTWGLIEGSLKIFKFARRRKEQ